MFLCVKTFIGRVVATSFLYLTVHRWVAGDVPIYQKFALKVTHPFRKRRFRQILLNTATAVRDIARIAIIANRKSTTRFPSAIDDPCALPLSPPYGGSKRELLHWMFAFYFFIAGNRRHFKFNTWVEHNSPSLQMTNRP